LHSSKQRHNKPLHLTPYSPFVPHSLSGAGEFGVVLLRDKLMKLPNLKYDFSHAVITRAQVGAQREITLTIKTLEWVGNQGHHSSEKYIHFDGIVNFGKAKEFFTRHLKRKHPELELAWLKYDESQNSKPGSLFIQLMCERTDDRLIIQCSNIEIN
jgi:hypothetical protein